LNILLSELVFCGKQSGLLFSLLTYYFNEDVSFMWNSATMVAISDFNLIA